MMNKLENIKFCILFGLLITILGSCKSQTNSFSKLEGKWSVSGEEGEGDDLFSWYLSYTFKKDSFFMDGYPPIYNQGMMKLVEEKGDSLLIEFISDPNSENGREPFKSWLVINNNTLSFEGKTFTKEGKNE